MATEGTFSVTNATSCTLFGSVSHKNNADEAVYFGPNGLPPGQTSQQANWYSGAGTHDSWYWNIQFNNQGAFLKGSMGCAEFDEDADANTVITIENGTITVAPPVSSSCGPNSLGGSCVSKSDEVNKNKYKP